MLEIEEYLRKSFIFFEKTGEESYKIGDQTYQLSHPNEEGVFFDENFNFIGTSISQSNYIYPWGSRWCTLPVGGENNTHIKELKEIGTANLCLGEIKSYWGVHGTCELLNGVGSYEDWASRASFFGYKSLLLCERNTLAGVFKFYKACKKKGITPIIGEEISLTMGDEVFGLKLIVKNYRGWSELLAIDRKIQISQNITLEDIRAVSQLIIVIDPKRSIYSESLFNLTPYYQMDTVRFGDEDRDRSFLETLKLYYRDKRFKPLFFCDSYYIEREDWEIKEDLNKIGSFQRPHSRNQYFKTGDDFYLELRDICREDDDQCIELWEECKSNVEYLSTQCHFEMITEERHLPKYNMTPEESLLYRNSEEMFFDLISKGIEYRKESLSKYTEGEVWGRIEEEIYTIERGDVIDYFLILWDMVRFAKSRGILVGKGRGSACGSLVAYLLDLTQINPFDYDLLFERFLNKGRISRTEEKDVLYFNEKIRMTEDSECEVERNSLMLYITAKDVIIGDVLRKETGSVKVESVDKKREIINIPGSLPDVDLDYQGTRRGEIKQYLETRYGKDQVCSVGVFQNYQIKAALKDISKLYGIPFERINSITEAIDGSIKTEDEFFSIACRDSRIRDFIKRYPFIINKVIKILGQPKSQGVHACAMMIYPSDRTSFEWVPIRLQDGDYVSQWEGSELDSVGFLKEDVLGISQLDKFEEILRLIKENRGETVDINNISLTDKRVFDLFKEGKNGDCFHFGSKGLTEYCKKMKPQTVDDLIASIALYRPGSMENGFHEQFIRRKFGKEDISIYVGADSILSPTYGIFVYQEQVMSLCRVLGGLTMVEADDVRKAMGKKILSKLDPYKKRFINYYSENFGVTPLYAEEVWSEIERASSYIFNKSHAAAYAITGYTSQWLKVHYPVEYWTVAFSYAKDDDFSEYIAEINSSNEGVSILPVDINNSSANMVTDSKTGSMYWSLTSIKQVGEKASQEIFEDRNRYGQYFSLDEFLERHNKKGSKVTKSVVENLISCGAFDDLEGIEAPRDRKRLILKYHDIKNIKKEGVFYQDKVNTNWWWLLVQKNLCGFAWFDYEGLGTIYGERCDKFPYTEVSDINSFDVASESKATICGYVKEYRVSMSKKGSFGRIVLESNYEHITINIYGEIYEGMADNLAGMKNCLMVANGIVRYNEKRGKNELYLTSSSKISLFYEK